MSLELNKSTQSHSFIKQSVNADRQMYTQTAFPSVSGVLLQSEEITSLLSLLEERISRLTHREEIIEEVKALRAFLEDSTKQPPASSSHFQDKTNEERGKR